MDFRDQPSLVVGVADQPLHGPGQRGRRGFVPGHQQRHQLVADLDIAHRPAVFVPGLQQDGEHVVALVEVVGPASLIDLGVEQPVDAAKHFACDRGPDTPGGKGRQHERWAAGPRGQHPHQFCPQLVKARTLAQPEHCAQDDLQRQRPHPRVQAHRLAAWPAGDLSFRDSGDRVGVGRQVVAAERRHEKSALLPMCVLVKQQHRVRADHRQQDAICLPGVQQLGRPREDLFHRLRMGDHHKRALTHQPQSERVAVASRATLHEIPGADHPGSRLNEDRESGTRRQNIEGQSVTSDRMLWGLCKFKVVCLALRSCVWRAEEALSSREPRSINSCLT